MTPKLDPPSVPPLSPAQRTRLRRRVLNGVDPVGRHRRWAAPAIAVTAVGAVVASSVVLGDRPSDPLPAGPAATTPLIDKGRIVKTAGSNSVDLGAATAAEEVTAARRCRLPGAMHHEVLWSRKVSDPAPLPSRSGVVVLTQSTLGEPGGSYDRGLTACFPGGVVAAVRDSDWVKRPNPSQGLITLAGTGSIGSEGTSGPGHAEYQALHRVRPEIARIQSRYVWPTGQGEWSDGVVSRGFAYTASAAALPAGQYTPPVDGKDSSGVREEIRAFDRDGKPLPIKY